MFINPLICKITAGANSSISKNNYILFAIILFVCSNFQPAAAAEYSGSPEDITLLTSIQNNADKFVSDRSILWVEKGYLDTDRIHSLHQNIDTAILNIENFTGIEFDKSAYQKEKIEYFVYSGQDISRTITGYQPGKYMHPVIFLSFAAEKNAPYVHETVHVIAWDWTAPWLEEGLAVFLNDRLNGYPSFPNYGADIDILAASMLHFKSALKKMEQNEIPEFPTWEERQAFYVLSGSFVKYIYTAVGAEKLMAIYSAKDTRQAVVEMTGNTLEVLHNEWVQSLQ